MHQNVTNTIAALEEEGFSVKIRHERASKEDIERALEEIRLLDLKGREWIEVVDLPTAPKHQVENVSGFGGKTVATIFRGDTKLVEGVALCSPLDPFEKYTGSAKALGRAVGELRKAT